MDLLNKRKSSGFGLVGILIVLAIIFGIAILNWDKVKNFGDKTHESLEEGQEKVEDFREEVQEIEEKMKERLDESLQKKD